MQDSLYNFILSHSTPRKVIKVFLTKILQRDYEEPDIDVLLNDLQLYGTMLWHNIDQLPFISRYATTLPATTET